MKFPKIFTIFIIVFSFVFGMYTPKFILNKGPSSILDKAIKLETIFYETIYVDNLKAEVNELSVEQYNYNVNAEQEEREKYSSRTLGAIFQSNDKRNESTTLPYVKSNLANAPTITVNGNNYCKQVSFTPSAGYSITSSTYQYNGGSWFSFSNNKFFQVPGNYSIRVTEGTNRTATSQFSISSMTDYNNVGGNYDIPSNELYGDVAVSLTSSIDRSYSTHTLYIVYNSYGRYIDVQQKFVWDVLPSNRGVNDLMYIGWTSTHLSPEYENSTTAVSSRYRTEYTVSSELLGTSYDSFIEGEFPLANIGSITDNDSYNTYSAVGIHPYIPYDESFEFMGFYDRTTYTKMEFYLCVKLETAWTDAYINEIAHGAIIANYRHATSAITLSSSNVVSLVFSFINLDLFTMAVSITGISNAENKYDGGRPVRIGFDYA